jgi:hypothetical protein
MYCSPAGLQIDRIDFRQQAPLWFQVALKVQNDIVAISVVSEIVVSENMMMRTH